MKNIKKLEIEFSFEKIDYTNLLVDKINEIIKAINTLNFDIDELYQWKNRQEGL